MQLPEWMSEVENVERLIKDTFEAAKNKDFEVLERIHLRDDRFSKFDEGPPFRLLSRSEAISAEQQAYATISDYDYSIVGLKVSFFGEVAIATFILNYRGILVDGYSFRGATLERSARVTFVLVKKADMWYIAHEHLSPFPAEAASK